MSELTMQYQGDAEAFRQLMQQFNAIVMKIGWCQGETFDVALERYVNAALAHSGQPRVGGTVGLDGDTKLEEMVCRRHDVYYDPENKRCVICELRAAHAEQPAPSQLWPIVDHLRAEYPSYGAGETLSLPATKDVVEAVLKALAALGHSPNTVKVQEPPPEGIQHPDWGYDHHGNWVRKSAPSADTGEVKRLREALQKWLTGWEEHSIIGNDSHDDMAFQTLHDQHIRAIASAAPQEGSKP